MPAHGARACVSHGKQGKARTHGGAAPGAGALLYALAALRALWQDHVSASQSRHTRRSAESRPRHRPEALVRRQVWGACCLRPWSRLSSPPLSRCAVPHAGPAPCGALQGPLALPCWGTRRPAPSAQVPGRPAGSAQRPVAASLWSRAVPTRPRSRPENAAAVLMDICGSFRAGVGGARQGRRARWSS